MFRHFGINHPLYGAETLMDRWWSLLNGSQETWLTVDSAMRLCCEAAKAAEYTLQVLLPPVDAQ